MVGVWSCGACHFIYYVLLFFILDETTFYSKSLVCCLFTARVRDFFSPFPFSSLLHVPAHFLQTFLHCQSANAFRLRHLLSLKYLRSTLLMVYCVVMMLLVVLRTM